MKQQKWKLYLIIGAVIIGGYTIYARFFLEHTPIGGLCASTAACDGQCLGFGELLPDYSHQEVCTKECGGPSDCPGDTVCTPINLITTNGKGVKEEERHFCLPKGPLGGAAGKPQGGAS